MSDASDDTGADGSGDTADDVDTPGVERFPPADPGPFRAGAFDAEWIDPARDRRLPITVWYPTDATDGDTLAYFEGLVTVGGALAEAEPAGPGPWPIVIFSHGNQSFRAQSFFLTEHLATHGYVVIAADHIGNSTDTYETEEWVAATIERPKDVSALIDAAEAWNADPESPLHGLLDTERVGLVGHSFGGYTTFAAAGAPTDMIPIHEHCTELGAGGWSGEWAFCDRITDSRLDEAQACSPSCEFGDARLDATVAMAPAFAEFFVDGGLESIDLPVLTIAGTLDDPWSPEYAEDGYFGHLTVPDRLLWVLEGASHYSFSNACVLDILRAVPLFGCNDEVIEPTRGYRLVRAAVTAFLGVHVAGDSSYRTALEAPAACAETEVALTTADGPIDCGR